MNNELPIIALNDGRKFIIPGLTSYKNLRVVRTTECSAVIAGERKLKINDKEVWSTIPSGYTISPYTMVVPV